MSENTFDSLLQEDRTFAPPAEFAARALVSDPDVYARAEADPEAYWAGWARELHWSKPWDQVLEWNPPQARWFLGGKLNAAYNCLDRHLDGPRRTKTALLWEGEPGDRRAFTYEELHAEVSRAASALRSLGIGKGDRVAIYLPMIPEAAIAMLACARIGAAHSVVFGGFSAESLRDRINDADARLLITADGGYRRGGIVPLKRAADEALTEEGGCPSIEKVLVIQRHVDGAPVGGAVMTEGRDLWWHEVVDAASADCPAEEMDSEDLLYILYTSGTTGKPKGIMHTTGGYLTQAYATTKWVFDLKEDDVYWCTADVGWVTGHSYLVYGPLANGATVLMYEGAPDAPDRGRFWKLIQDYRVTILYTAPTAIRAFMKWGAEWLRKYDLSSLRLLGSVGEPINPEAWMWYHEHVGGGRCPIVDTWWQTETGAIMITPLPGVTETVPGSATTPFPGIRADILSLHGEHIPAGGGFLAIRRPWPSMLRGIWGDPVRFQETYWSKWQGETVGSGDDTQPGEGVYFPGDGAKRDERGYFWVIGRIDDVLNVAGHRIGTMEVESALVDHPAVAEAAVVGKAHELKGQAVAAFVTLKEGLEPTEELKREISDHVVRKIGAIARPDTILYTADLPKTRSGKIMRRLLKDIAEGRTLGDTTTLADPSVVAQLKDDYEAKGEA
ncbi:acetyl-CoA synthetase [Longimicrobium terrae]|uniref:Acetyl-coenzyme A synthetase n=2 Tax=Longimicrobium terrae TaxID=1639882 RepID=A0A841H283_9BACT|nr:acetate--CoA ligase [Longimicrobium terrae]MBB4637740.1 acetyl-CoA synthetase [Longimicrobium terrae]MBB6072137.1 acetyl-CoA synthetase [Longimicrobium terrae]NNC29781.1 acetate--CoA ligase [Longimicrobium terrae]